MDEVWDALIDELSIILQSISWSLYLPPCLTISALSLFRFNCKRYIFSSFHSSISFPSRTVPLSSSSSLNSTSLYNSSSSFSSCMDAKVLDTNCTQKCANWQISCLIAACLFICIKAYENIECNLREIVNAVEYFRCQLWGKKFVFFSIEYYWKIREHILKVEHDVMVSVGYFIPKEKINNFFCESSIIFGSCNFTTSLQNCLLNDYLCTKKFISKKPKMIILSLFLLSCRIKYFLFFNFYEKAIKKCNDHELNKDIFCYPSDLENSNSYFNSDQVIFDNNLKIFNLFLNRLMPKFFRKSFLPSFSLNSSFLEYGEEATLNNLFAKLNEEKGKEEIDKEKEEKKKMEEKFVEDLSYIFCCFFGCSFNEEGDDKISDSDSKEENYNNFNVKHANEEINNFFSNSSLLDATKKKKEKTKVDEEEELENIYNLFKKKRVNEILEICYELANFYRFFLCKNEKNYQNFEKVEK